MSEGEKKRSGGKEEKHRHKPGGTPTPAGLVARDYCLRFPRAPTWQLARMLRRDEPLLFKSVKAARRLVLYYRGASGHKDRGKAERGGRLVPRLELPEPAPSRFRFHKLPDEGYRWLVIADLHIPFHSNEAIRLALDFAKARSTRCDAVLILGDFIDSYQLSHWLRDPRERRFSQEIEDATTVLDVILQELKPKAVIWKAGNHEYRHDRYLMQHAPEIFGIEEFSIPNYCDLERRGVEWVERGHPIVYRNLLILHGDEYKGGATSPVNPARTFYLRTHECTLAAHLHKTSEHTEQTARGVTITCWSIGCLCDLHPEWSPLNKWNQGFAVLDTRDNWRIENYRIVEGEIV